MTAAKRKPGPKPERVKIEGNWEDAIDQALAKEKPKDGWPDHKTREEGDDGKEPT